MALLKRPFKIWSRSKMFNPKLLRFANFLEDPEIPVFSDYFFINKLRAGVSLRRIVVRSSAYAYLTREAIEAFRKVISPNFRKKRQGISRFYIRCYPHLPLIKKPAEVRIGGGKGNKLRTLVCPIKPGQILFEITHRPTRWSMRLLKFAARKLSITVSISTILFLYVYRK